MRLISYITSTVAALALSSAAYPQTFMEAVEVTAVKNTYAAAERETEKLDIKAALLSADNKSFSILLGQCLFPLDEPDNDLILQGLAQASGSGLAEVTFAGRLQEGERVNIVERAPVPCSSDDYRAAIITRVKDFDAARDAIEIHILSLKPNTANIFARMTGTPDPELDGFTFSALPNGYRGDQNIKIIMNMRDRSVPDDHTTPEEQEVIDDVLSALVELGVRFAVAAIIGA